MRPLRILMASDVDPVEVIGGAERMLREHSVRLARRGHEVVVLTRAGEHAPPGEADCDGVRVVRHPVATGAAHVVQRSILREGGDAFERLHADRPFDLINIHQPLAGASVLRRPASRSTPVLYTYLSPWHEEYRTRVRARSEPPADPARRLAFEGWVRLNTRLRLNIERECVRRADRLMVLSSFTLDQLREFHAAPDDRVTIIPGGVNSERFRPAVDRDALRRRLGIDGELLFTVRNLVPRMGLDALIDAMATIVRARPACRLWIGGSGPLRGALEEQVSRLGLGDAVRFLGFISEADLPDYYGAADVFVLPTRMLEGFGLVTVEALACGTPAIGTPVGGTREILSAFDPSLLFPSTEADDMARTVLSRLKANAVDPAIRERCRQHVLDRYAWDALIPRVEAEMRELVARAGSSTTRSPAG